MDIKPSIKVGVLALQGAVSEHIDQLKSLGVEGVTIKQVEQLEQIDALILPGGESTTMGKLMREYDFIRAIQHFAETKPIFGTCAGMILLAKIIQGGEDPHLGLMDIAVQRNAFGRQIDSFQTALPVIGLTTPFPAIFIRAPYIAELLKADQIEVLATIDGSPVLAQQKNLLACAFHPELSQDNRIMQLFLTMIPNYQG
ncbi:pyridoxal 5'-phosphate synthase glutaminase subunit PdxT [Mergibacter septicus]|uniref:pyridoxal 5'-phosphate synthase glutaminase subunit PdxT n=1 Tax=Mergibacter septicus TaxID=221402 RepID=UPI0011797989|nr:pyridoxal 5'-phosphate synthase glutaminase subunit PdxT [Mergibacter septicus]AWX13287.1 pyridoxal 5'-phosphate synthase glutaminase subunit PdxT [Mergibacter septicus]